ncbi:glycosyltransferase [candidate division KSB1 bacterium]|nr:glycosyltransferase [candidate division KSB1 bacterium]
MKPTIYTIEDYEPLIGKRSVEQIKEKAIPLQDMHIANVNSTYYGGGVSVLLSSLTILLNGLGIKTGWRVIQGSPDFFNITKRMHNALQGGKINLTDRKKRIYQDVLLQNVMRNHIDHDVVIIHDPQPLLMINHYRKRGPWIWRCHIDISEPHKALWGYLKPHIEKFDAVIVSSDAYKQDLKTPQVAIMPAIDPFSILNQDLTESEIAERLDYYDIPTDLPLVVQISRFDKWKDPQGVIDAFKKARKKVDATLVLLGNVATDDPEGVEVYKSLLDQREERILILSQEDTALVNALQRRAAVVLQKSIREGFGLTVSEAMWKGTPVIGGDVGGIRFQIENGRNGFLVSSVDEAAERIVQVVSDKKLREQMSKEAHETVKNKFLLSRYLEQYLDLFLAFEPEFRLVSDKLNNPKNSA